MFSRRNLATAIGGLVVTSALLGCGANTSGPGAPTLAQVQQWVGVLSSELPSLVQESINSGVIPKNDVNAVNQGVATFQTLANQVMSPNFDVSNAVKVVGQLSVALGTILSVIPATAPYVGLIQIGLAVVSGFLALTPMVVPTPPSKVALAQLHKDNVKFQH